ncbi:MAG: ornithine carbamoyltransferase [Candidatus Omnitrophica bacterium]|nr:ornithine carbamoyltransferase [Candidatus Omnitrophota bacterium]
MKNLISAFDLNETELKAIFDLTKRIKQNPLAFRDVFDGKALGLIFEKPSTRTWVSFEVGFSTMGGHVIYLGPEDIQLGVREEVRDVARVLARYLDLVVLRTYSHRLIIEFAKYFDKLVINGLSDLEHPCQALADFYTIKESLGDLKGKKIAFVGDGNNVLNSLLILAARLGAHLSYATPKKFSPKASILSRALKEAKRTGAKIAGTHQPAKAVSGADIIYTDVWVSMGEEDRVGKKEQFKGFQINRALLKKAAKAVRVMHCLPAHRGEEITNDVIEGKHSIVFDQAENRLHVQKAILLYLLGTSGKSVESFTEN